MHYSAKRGCDCMSSVRPSVTLVDQDHIGWKSWKLIASTISPTPSLFVGNFWEIEVGWGKSGALEQKSDNL